MSVLEVERTQRKQRIRRIHPKWSPLDKPISASHPDQILSFHEWCRLNRISERTGHRILAGLDGPGPVVTQLTKKRIGITVANNAIWQRSRERV